MICEYCLKKTKYYSSNIDSFTNETFKIYYCGFCYMASTSNAKNIDLKKYYPKNYYGKNSKKFNFLIECIVFFFRYLRYRFCIKLVNKEKIKLLDIGCGRGNFLYLMQKNKADVYGTEFSINSGFIAKQKIGESKILINQDFDEIKNLKTNFNLITLWHVLEHLQDLKKICRTIDENLTKNGYLIVEVPNFKSFQSIMNKNQWIYLECPRHINHFTIKALNKIFNKKKYKTIKFSTFSIEYGFFGMLQSLLNIFVPIPNYLFSIIRNKDSKINHYSLVKNFISFIITGILITPLFLISLIFEILAVILKKGGVVRIVYKKI